MIRLVAVFSAMMLFACSAYGQDEGGLFTSTGSGLLLDASTWVISEGNDSDGLPDANDSLLIQSGHEIRYVGSAASPLIHDMEIAEGAKLIIDDASPQQFWMTGRLLIRGSLIVEGPHRLVFDGNEEYLSGIKAMSGSELYLHGHNLGEGQISQFRMHGDGTATITMEAPDSFPDSLAGTHLKLMDGKAANEVFEVIEHSGDELVIGLRESINSPIRPEAFFNDKIRIEKSLLSGAIFPNRFSMSPLFAGMWVKILATGSMYMIMGVRIEGSSALLLLDRALEAGDRIGEIKIAQGIAEGDSYILYDPLVATVPEQNRGDGIGQSMLVAEESIIDIQFARFEYFGSHIGKRHRFGGWKRSTAGLAFLQTRSAIIRFSEFYKSAAATNVLFENGTDIEISRNYMSDAHPAINPTGAQEVGHGWVLQNVDRLNFEENIVRNMDDDLIYVGRNSTNLTFINNKLINTPIIRGNSANSLEIVSNHASPFVTIEKNLMINADVNLHVDLRNGGEAHINENVIASTLRWRSANVVLENVKGLFNANELYYAPAGAVILGSSEVNLAPNTYTGHYVDVIKKSNMQRNAWITLGILMLGIIVVRKARHPRFKLVVFAIYAALFVFNVLALSITYFAM